MAINQATRGTPRMDLGVAFWEFMPSPEDFIGLQVLPIAKVNQQAAKFSKITREGMMKLADSKRSGGNYNRIDAEAEDSEFTCEEHGLESRLGDDKRRLFATDFDAELVTTKNVWLKLMMNLELRIKTLVFNTSTFTGSALYTDNSSAPWDTITTDIIGQVLAAEKKVYDNTGMVPNALIVGYTTLINMLANTGIKNMFPGAPLITRAMLEAALPKIFGLDKLIIGKGKYDSAKEGQASTVSDIWVDDYAMVARVASDGDTIDTPCLGRTFLWVPDSPEIMTVDEYREEQTRSDVYRGRHYVDELLIEPYCGHLLKVDA